MEDNWRITRRNFMLYSLTAAASAVIGDAVADDRLQRYRDMLLGTEKFAWYTKMFGRDPILTDGGIEKISYEQWERDQRKGTLEFNAAVLEAKKFMTGTETRKLYRETFGTDAPWVWLKDRQKVAVALLQGLHVPDYEQHKTIRGLLVYDGVLDFEAHKKAVEQGLRAAPKYLAHSAALQKTRDIVSELVDEKTIDDAAHGLEHLYMLTLPIFDAQQYKSLEGDIIATLRKGAKALERAKNLEDALKKEDYIKTAHQVKAFITGFKDVLDAASKLNSRSLALRTGAMPRAKPFDYTHSDAQIYAYDFIVDEWTQLDLHRWAEGVKKQATGLIGMEKKK